MSFQTSELHRRFENLIRIGTIADADHQRLKVRVQTGELLTQWLDWPATIGRNFIHWRPLQINTQVVLACPSGDTTQAVIISMLYSHAIASPSHDANLDSLRFTDGTTITYNSKTQSLNIQAIKQLNLHSPNGDIIINGISLLHHTHPQNNGNDNGGSVNTGEPQ